MLFMVKSLEKLKTNNYYEAWPYYNILGFFKSLNQEFILTDTPVSITIMPLPYVFTQRVSVHIAMYAFNDYLCYCSHAPFQCYIIAKKQGING